jgi:ornithine--oxo-acid transaminase
MNTGVEGGETAIKLARLWGYKHKRIPENQATIVMANHNFWGRTVTACSSSTNPTCYKSFGPYTPGFEFVEYNNIDQLKELLVQNPNIAAYMMEPIQGEAGIIVPNDTYLKEVRELCTEHEILLICDEVQTGIGRTGEMLASDLWNVRADIVILGKALSGGMMPISAVLCDDHIMRWMKPGMHGSTFGGNPLASKIAVEAIEVVKDENLMENAECMGAIFRERMTTYKKIKDVRGKGLLNAIELYTTGDAEKFVDLCMQKGLLCKITHGTSVRMCPPLTITAQQMKDSLEIIDEVLTVM